MAYLSRLRMYDRVHRQHGWRLWLVCRKTKLICHRLQADVEARPSTWLWGGLTMQLGVDLKQIRLAYISSSTTCATCLRRLRRVHRGLVSSHRRVVCTLFVLSSDVTTNLDLDFENISARGAVKFWFTYQIRT